MSRIYLVKIEGLRYEESPKLVKMISVVKADNEFEARSITMERAKGRFMDTVIGIEDLGELEFSKSDGFGFGIIVEYDKTPKRIILHMNRF